MPQMVDEAGNIWEVDAAGNPVSFVGKQGGQGNTVITKRANPTERRGDDLKNQLTQAQIQKLIADMNKPEKDPNAPDLPKGYMWKNGVVGGDAVLIPGVAAPGANASGKTDKAGAYNSVIAQIDRLYELYNDGIGKTEGIAGILDYLPTETNAVFDTAGAALGDQGNAAFKVPGMGAQSDADAARFVAANQPMASDKDAAALEKLRALRQRLESNMQAVGLPAPQWNYGLDGQPIKQKRDQMAVAGNPGGPQGPDKSSVWLGDAPQPDNGGFAPYGAKYRTQDNPALAGVNVAIGKMIANGASRDQIMAFAASKGVQLDSGTKFGNETPVGRAWMKANPGKPYPVNVDDETVPMSGWEQARNNVPQWEDPVAGISPGTMAATALNAGGMGIPQMLAGGQGLDYLRSQNSGSAFAGDVAGVIGGTSLIGKIGREGAERFAPQLLERAAEGAGFIRKAGDVARTAAPDVAYGAIYGGTTEGKPLTGALTAGAGSLGGQFAGKTLGSLIAPTGGKLSGVMADGARPTLGQRFVNSGGPVGKTINGVEEIFKSYPILGAAVDTSREAGRQSWQRAGFQRSLAALDDSLPEGVGAGPEAFKYTRKAFDDTYDQARSGMQFVPDQGYQQDFGQWQQNWINGGLLDSEGIKQVQKAIETRVGSRMRDGILSGDTYKKAVSDLNSTINNVGKPEVKKALAEYRTVLDDAARRNSDPNAVALMDKADLGYSQFKPLKDAARRAGSEPGYFTPQGLAAVERQSMGKTNSYLEGDTRLGDYIRQGDNFRDRVPNSGTPERLLTLQGIASPAVGAAGFFNPATLAAAGLTLPYMPIIEKGAKAIIAPRQGAKAKKLGGIFGGRESQRAISGAITAPLLIE